MAGSLPAYACIVLCDLSWARAADGAMTLPVAPAMLVQNIPIRRSPACVPVMQSNLFHVCSSSLVRDRMITGAA